MTETRMSLLQWIVDDPRSNEAWQEFFAAYDPLLRSYILKRTRGRGLNWDDYTVDEVRQAVRLKLFAALPDFKLRHEVGRFRTWLYRVTSNVIVDHVRRTMRGQRDHKLLDEGQVDFNLVAGQDDEPDDDWIALYGAAVLQAALDEVRRQIEPKNPNKWAAFQLYTLEHKKAPEVAGVLGISINLVYQNALRVYQEIERLCRVKYEEALTDA